MRDNSALLIFIAIFVGIILLGRSCDRSRPARQNQVASNYSYQEEGLDKVIKRLRDEQNYTILLHDMNYENDKFLHQYQVLIPETDTTFEEEVTDWMEVSPKFFQAHENDLGMELASKTDGKLTKNVAPPGYSQYVGNEKYGQWVNRNGGSFWEFYGKYAMLSTVFGMFNRPVGYNSWNTFDRNYRGRGAYYGPDGYYGTRSYTNSNRGRQTTWAQKPQSFKDRVNSRVQRSTTQKRSTVTRSSNRYSSSSYRSRGGGYGK